MKALAAIRRSLMRWMVSPVCSCLSGFDAVSLIPRWRFMTDESKALVKRGALSLLVVFVAVVVLRALLPWVLLALIIWFVWSWVARH